MKSIIFPLSAGALGTIQKFRLTEVAGTIKGCDQSNFNIVIYCRCMITKLGCHQSPGMTESEAERFVLILANYGRCRKSAHVTSD